MKRERTVSVRVTPEEYMALVKRSVAAGCKSVPEYVRKVLDLKA